MRVRKEMTLVCVPAYSLGRAHPPPPPPPLTLLSWLRGLGSTDGAKHIDCCWCARAASA